MGDWHLPFHNEKALSIAFDVISDFKPDEIVLMGDIFDCYSISRFENKNPYKISVLLSDEIESGANLIDQMVRTSNANKFVFIGGNHEKRISSYIFNKAPAVSNYFPDLKNIFMLPKKFTYIENAQDQGYKMGTLVARHKTYQNQHACHKTLTRATNSYIFGHTHRIQYRATTTLEGQTIEAWSIGWLGDPIKAGDYMDVSPEWCHAIALGWFAGNNHAIQIVTIKDGRALANECFYQAKKSSVCNDLLLNTRLPRRKTIGGIT